MNMKKLILCFSILQIQSECMAQSHSYTGLCAYSKNLDAFSWTVQPAVLAQQVPAGFSLLAEKKFMLQDLNYLEANISLDTKWGNFGFQAQGLINPGYLESHYNLAYGKMVARDLSLGVNFGYSQSGNKRYGIERKYTSGLGVLCQLSEKLFAGFFAKATTGSNFLVSTDIRIGMGYDVSPLVHLSLQIIKKYGHQASAIAGLHYQLTKRLWARAGIDTGVSGWWMGVGMFLTKFRIDLVNNYHPQLGFSPAIILFFSFNKPAK